VPLDQLPEGIGITGSGPAYHGKVGRYLHPGRLRLGAGHLVRFAARCVVGSRLSVVEAGNR